MGSIRRPFLNPKPLVLAIHIATFSIAALPLLAHAAPTQVNIPAGNLAQVLNLYALEQGVNIIFDSTLLSGIKSQGIQGSYEINDGFTELLKNTNYQIKQTSNGYRLEKRAVNAKKEEVVKLTPLQSEANQLKRTGLAGTSGSVLPTITLEAENQDAPLKRINTVGVLGNKSVIDTPYSITTKTAEEIETRQTNSLGKIFVGDPSIVTEVNSYSSGWSTPVSIRGLKLDETNGYKVNGYSVSAWGGEFPVELAQNVMALKGLSGLMYGFATPGGIINYQTKQPTEENLLSTKIGYRSAGILSASLDAGGRVGEDKQFGYRFNIVKEKGETYNGSDADNLATALALDYRILPNLVWKGEILYQDRHLDNEASMFSWWGFEGNKLPKPIDGSDKHIVKGAFYTIHSALAQTGLYWQINDDWKAEITQARTRNRNFVNKTFAYILNEQGDYSINMYQLGGESVRDTSQLMISGLFNTGFIKHDLVFGGSFEKKEMRDGNYNWDANVATGNIYQPQTTYYDKPMDFTQTDSGNIYQKQVFASDTLSLNDHWQAIIAGRYINYNNQANTYQKEVVTPTYALIYKPIEDWSFYASYSEALEEGKKVTSGSGQQYANEGQYLDPTISKQYEIGTKYQQDRWHASAALYRLERMATIDETVNGQLYLTQNGETVYQGFELMGGYKFTPDLTINAGINLNDPSIEKVSEANAAIKGKRPSGASKIQAVVQADWNIPYMEGLSVHGDVRHYGDTWYDDENTIKFDDYTLVNIGGGYQTRISNKPVTFRADINNLLNKKYWMNSGAGEPITFVLSAKVDW
ncbi:MULTISPECIES: TonB-dependent siderophore receptor [unclassified Acinetobacter]|uniref:TonB-dependent siderophore receptor n=1 Tax=unclassified Acinetobacter TaxID=196816 RepID=UPI001909E4EA|nr:MULTISPECIES: TonB-dependent receptor [unclassified Acinetobacter]MBK0063267.1 TonB-dependent receptor [Acinetobacter sp. S55]MBK0066821.1 TonB-dependent receptor [Acinetobacter sp. S54]